MTQVVSLLPGVTEDQLYAWAAGAEARSEHPLGKAVVRGWRERGGELPPETGFRMLPGRGWRRRWTAAALSPATGSCWRSGSALGGDRDAAAPALEEGCTLIYLAADGQPAGFLALADTLRPDAAETIRQVRAAGVTPVLLTGDHEKAARHIAGALGIGQFRAECLPRTSWPGLIAASRRGSRCAWWGTASTTPPP